MVVLYTDGIYRSLSIAGNVKYITALLARKAAEDVSLIAREKNTVVISVYVCVTTTTTSYENQSFIVF